MDPTAVEAERCKGTAKETKIHLQAPSTRIAETVPNNERLRYTLCITLALARRAGCSRGCCIG